MPGWMLTVIGVLGGLVAVWGALVIALLVQHRRSGRAVDWRSALRLAPDILRLIKRLAADRGVPRATRWWLVALLAYLLSPIDLIPDFVPVVGYLDDAIVTVVALRFALKHAGVVAVERNWPGTPAGLAAVLAVIQPKAHREGS